MAFGHKYCRHDYYTQCRIVQEFVRYKKIFLPTTYAVRGKVMFSLFLSVCPRGRGAEVAERGRGTRSRHEGKRYYFTSGLPTCLNISEKHVVLLTESSRGSLKTYDNSTSIGQVSHAYIDALRCQMWKTK